MMQKDGMVLMHQWNKEVVHIVGVITGLNPQSKIGNLLEDVHHD